MRILTLGQLREKTKDIDDATPIFIDYQGIAINIEYINSEDGNCMLHIGGEADMEEDILTAQEK